MDKYVVEIKDQNNRIIESVETNNKYYAKWLCDFETKENGHNCVVRRLDDFVDDNVIL